MKLDSKGNRLDVGPGVTKRNGKSVKKAWRKEQAALRKGGAVTKSLKRWARESKGEPREWLKRKRSA